MPGVSWVSWGFWAINLSHKGGKVYNTLYT